MVLQIFYWCVLTVLAIKVFANLVLPYGVLWSKEGEGASIVFLLAADVFLVSVIVFFAFMIDHPATIYEWKTSLILSAGAVSGSYLHYFAVLAIADIMKSRAAHDSAVDDADDSINRV